MSQPTKDMSPEMADLAINQAPSLTREAVNPVKTKFSSLLDAIKGRRNDDHVIENPQAESSKLGETGPSHFSHPDAPSNKEFESLIANKDLQKDFSYIFVNQRQDLFLKINVRSCLTDVFYLLGR
jgi:hypothetical protein